MQKKRIQVYTDPETHRRVELAAAKRGVSVTEYCLRAIQQQLLEDEIVEAEKIEARDQPSPGKDVIEELRDLRERIKARRGGKLITVDILEQVRAEREHELLGVR